ncbi:Fe-S-containing hydro-lyase [Petrocella sp. FN5]|uniref:Fe-S-containing hydro-lyase n=1 Tax=Petrocella sp. FN5 TaxID=3032002 RepID=UPI0023DAE688|nr:Fe-S-containing hydro-lyase [Petrocella sp. FN5]MDF1618404.1 Fe-S-containing hydro-lyase [Petrocella sp. FN5]
MRKKITTPLNKEKIIELSAGDEVLLSGEVYTSRDAGHKRMIEQMERGENLPFDIKDAIIYYVGPSPNKPGEIIGSAGPTTSYRMDAYTPKLLDSGLSGMIGKGDRNEAVISAMIRNKAIYFAAVGGAAALIADKIVSSEIIAYDDLGTEALRKLIVKDFPCIVVIDSEGHDLYKSEKEKHRITKTN